MGRGENWERLGSAGIAFTSLSKFRGKKKIPRSYVPAKMLKDMQERSR